MRQTLFSLLIGLGAIGSVLSVPPGLRPGNSGGALAAEGAAEGATEEGKARAGTGAPQTAALSELDRADLARIERYLTGIRTLRSRFLQVSSAGVPVEGDLYLNRPGKMRFEYDPPYPALLMADGLVLLYYDKELKEETYLPLWETPLWFLLRDEVELDDSVRVIALKRGPGVLRVTLEQNEESPQGKVTLVFADKPLALKKWVVTDAQGVTTEVALLGPRVGVEIDDEIFDRLKLLREDRYDGRR
ncbi:MAG: outer membrane lipoprotein carrier protein LolA [Kiloniellales bacterium]|nr:outer membrane lipoprotein carrier protein LolA [Kiloniellales bacterium]